MRWKMPNVAVVAVAAAAALYLVTAETMLAADGGGGDDDGGGGGGSGRKHDAATAAAAGRHQDIGTGDKSSQTPAAVQCSSCLAHEGIKSLSIELIKMSILNKLGMDRPPVFSGRQPPKVPTDLPPLQDLIRRYNNDVGPMVVMPHIRHKSHHYNASGDGGGVGDGGTDFQNEEAGYASATATPVTSSMDNGGEDEDDDYHVKKHKFLAFAQLHPTMQKLNNRYLLYFTFSEQVRKHRITEVILWLYRKRTDIIFNDQTILIEVRRINPTTTHESFVSSLKYTINSTEPGWIAIDLRRRMNDWFKMTDGSKNLSLIVHASYHNKNMTHTRTPFVTDARKRDDMAEIPYLEVHTEDGMRSRSKRNVLGMDCDEFSDEQLCCRYPLKVDFEEFGWNWIIAPKSYDANYCSGECPLEFLQKYPHTHLALLTNKTGMYPGTGPCCAPRKLSPISMLYFDQDMNIIYGLLPGMVVDRCGCS